MLDFALTATVVSMPTMDILLFYHNCCLSRNLIG